MPRLRLALPTHCWVQPSTRRQQQQNGNLLPRIVGRPRLLSTFPDQVIDVKDILRHADYLMQLR